MRKAAGSSRFTLAPFLVSYAFMGTPMFTFSPLSAQHIHAQIIFEGPRQYLTCICSTAPDSSMLIGLFSVCSALGRIGWGLLSDRFRHHRYPDHIFCSACVSQE